MDLDFYEYCREPERRSRRKMILSLRRRANTLLVAGYSLEQIAGATLSVEKTKKERAASLKASGFSNPWELLSGAVDTSGKALKTMDVLGVGAAAGVVGSAVVGVSRTGIRGVNTVVGVGADMTMSTRKLLVSTVQESSRAVTGVATGVAGGVVGGAKVVTRPVSKVVRRSLALAVSPITSLVSVGERQNSPTAIKEKETEDTIAEKEDTLRLPPNESVGVAIGVQ
jgi:hypothetical protein